MGVSSSQVFKGCLLRSIRRPWVHPKDTITGDVIWGPKATSTQHFMEGSSGLEEVSLTVIPEGSNGHFPSSDNFSV